MRSIGVTVTLAGIASVGAMLALAISKAPLGTPLFFALAALAGVSYLVVLVRVWHTPSVSRGLFFSALAFAVLMRAPVAVAPVSVRPRPRPAPAPARAPWDQASTTTSRAARA